MRRILYGIGALVGVFFILIPFVGSRGENESHHGALTVISLLFGLVFLIVGGYQAIKGPGTKK